MLKPAIARVIWDSKDASYQVQEKTALGGTILAMDFESEAWQEWLAQHSSFAFLSRDGQRFTARKETRARGSSYWVAYRKIGGKLTHTYLGRSEDITLSRLEQVAHSLTEPRSKPSAPLPSQEQQTQHETPSELGWQEHLLATKFLVPVPPTS